MMLKGMLITLLVLTASAFGQETQESSPADETSLFEERLINTIVRNNLFIITTARMALQRSMSDEVKDLARTEITYHTQTGEALIWIAQQSGVTITGNRPSELSEERARLLDQLDDLKGPAFDEVYLEVHAEVHETAVDVLGQLPSVVTNPGMQFLVNSALPIMKRHLEIAHNLMP